jgi:hypothetical protein
MFTSSVVDRGFLGGVMVSMLTSSTSSVVDRGFIGGVMVSGCSLSKMHWIAHIIIVKGDVSLIGQIVDVKITDARGNSLIGELLR